LREEAQKVLQDIAPVLVKSGRPIRIEGHTDNLPISTLEYRSNWQLSAARAANVVYFLTRSTRVPPGQLSIGAFADQLPIDTNDTAEGRQRNRRVDIVFLKGQWKDQGQNEDLLISAHLE
jgi:chemotaxis protein MotB